jgi:hypothetical protein
MLAAAFVVAYPSLTDYSHPNEALTRNAVNGAILFLRS